MELSILSFKNTQNQSKKKAPTASGDEVNWGEKTVLSISHLILFESASHCPFSAFVFAFSHFCHLPSTFSLFFLQINLSYLSSLLFSVFLLPFPFSTALFFPVVSLHTFFFLTLSLDNLLSPSPICCEFFSFQMCELVP